MKLRGWLSTTIAALVVAFPGAQLAHSGESSESPSAFEGTWKGICGDGKPFVILSPQASGKELAGDVSIANMNGEEGQCSAVLDPPSPEHAMKIRRARIEGKILSFQGSPNARFEMSLENAQSARLKLLGTPVEDNPWRLAKSADGSR
jgi:hypothetical protein